jgi:hypothetical protein
LRGRLQLQFRGRAHARIRFGKVELECWEHRAICESLQGAASNLFESCDESDTPQVFFKRLRFERTMWDFPYDGEWAVA